MESLQTMDGFLILQHPECTQVFLSFIPLSSKESLSDDNLNAYLVYKIGRFN
jgi:hypothetical protein